MNRIYTILIAAILFVECKKDNANEPFVASITHNVEVQFDDYFQNQPAQGVSVVFSSLQEGIKYEIKTNSQGKATLSLPVGSYNINASLQLTKDQMKALSGQEKEAFFNASLDLKRINATTNEPTKLTLVTGKIGDIIIKQIYSVGSDTKLGAYNRDQFIEVHNNSNETIYLDNLCIAHIHGTTTDKRSESFTLPNGLIDWQQSPDLVGSDSSVNTDYVYSSMVVGFPGTGKDYPLESGRSVIMARMAQNHKAPLVIGNKKYEVGNPDLTVDLSKAHFETYYQMQNRGQDIDNPSVPNMKEIYLTTTLFDFTMGEAGGESYAIFYKTTDFDTYKKVRSPEKNRSGNLTNRLYLQIPIAAIIDGVNIKPSDGRLLPDRLPQSVDSGSISYIKGLYSSESAIRKTTKKVGKKTYYQDTNNSVNDFEILDRPNTESIQ